MDAFILLSEKSFHLDKLQVIRKFLWYNNYLNEFIGKNIKKRISELDFKHNQHTNNI